MRMTNRIAFVLGCWLIATSSALATTSLYVSGGGLTAPNANYGCPAGSANCLSSLDFVLASPALATGAIVVNDLGTIASISMDVASATFSPVYGASEIFTNVHYSGDVSIFSVSGTISQLGAGTGTVSGLLNGIPFSTSSAIYNLTCAQSGGSGQCGVAYGPQIFTADGQNWLHTFDVIVSPNPLPEPSALLLLLIGAAGLTLRRR
ncbi:MAG: PEP-CTERM sorting domain-containing protein [Myxococcota bacterium]